MKISILKWNLQTIVTSLNELQMHRDNITQNPLSLSNEITEITECKKSLEIAFATLKTEYLNKIIKQLKKRNTKRHTKKLQKKKKLCKKTNSSTSSKLRFYKYNTHTALSFTFAKEQPTLSGINKCKLRTCKRYLSSIDCLETLHRLKAGEDSCKLGESLKTIKSIWKSTEHCIKEEINNKSLPNRWDKVLFGGNLEFEILPRLEELLERRYTWDSYLDSSNGSHIPVGWVFPKAVACLKWKQFLQKP